MHQYLSHRCSVLLQVSASRTTCPLTSREGGAGDSRNVNRATPHSVRTTSHALETTCQYLPIQHGACRCGQKRRKHMRYAPVPG